MNLAIISPPENRKDETELVNALFDAGLEKFHLRKPTFRAEVVMEYLKKLDPFFWDRVVIHYHFELLVEFPMAGFHFNRHNLEWIKFKHLMHKSYSAHSFNEIIALNKERFDYIFLSPVFDSISKPGYTKQFEKDALGEFLKSDKACNSIIALGGIDDGNLEMVRDMGFSGAALMGSIWNPLQKGESVNNLVDKFIKMQQVWQSNLMF